jgi:hypothetical protein
MTFTIVINLMLSAIVFATIIILISRTILPSRPTPARGDRLRERSTERRGLGARLELDSRA